MGADTSILTRMDGQEAYKYGLSRLRHIQGRVKFQLQKRAFSAVDSPKETLKTVAWFSRTAIKRH